MNNKRSRNISNDVNNKDEHEEKEESDVDVEELNEEEVYQYTPYTQLDNTNLNDHTQQDNKFDMNQQNTSGLCKIHWKCWLDSVAKHTQDSFKRATDDVPENKCNAICGNGNVCTRFVDSTKKPAKPSNKLKQGHLQLKEIADEIKQEQLQLKESTDEIKQEQLQLKESTDEIRRLMEVLMERLPDSTTQK